MPSFYDTHAYVVNILTVYCCNFTTLIIRAYSARASSMVMVYLTMFLSILVSLRMANARTNCVTLSSPTDDTPVNLYCGEWHEVQTHARLLLIMAMIGSRATFVAVIRPKATVRNHSTDIAANCCGLLRSNL